MNTRSSAPLCAFSLLALGALAIGGCAPTETRETNASSDQGSQGALARQLDGMTARFHESAPPERAETFEQGIAQVRARGVESRALGVGAEAPRFSLPDAQGRATSLDTLLRAGPVVLTWYRGGWCPYCDAQLSAYQDRLDDFLALGATVVAISPDLPDRARATQEQGGLGFVVLSDAANRTARRYGLVYRLPDDVHARLAENLDLSSYTGDNSGELPLSATYVIDREGIIRYAFVDADYRRRAEPDDLLDAIRGLRAP